MKSDKFNGSLDDAASIAIELNEKVNEEQFRAMWRLVSKGIYDVKWDVNKGRVVFQPVVCPLLAWTEEAYPPPGTNYIEERIALKIQLHRDFGFLIDAKSGAFFTNGEDSELKVYALDQVLKRIQLLLESVLAVDWRPPPSPRTHFPPFLGAQRQRLTPSWSPVISWAGT